MIFNSIEFAIFLPIVFFAYWFIVGKKYYYQNFLIMISSFFFYGWWDWRFLLLLLFTAGIDFIVALKLYKTKIIKLRKYYLSISIVSNLAVLGFFKYFNFFIDNFINAFTFFGSHLSKPGLSIVLPVGISFYTFQN